MGADDNWQSNLFLPFGKVRMGYPSGEARWGLMSICRVTTTPIPPKKEVPKHLQILLNP